MAYTSANQLELLQTAEAVAREKNIEPRLVVEAMEESLARAAKSRYGAEMDIRVAIDRKTGARGLRSIMEGILLDTMYDLPSSSTARKVVVDEAVVTGETQPYVIYESEETPTVNIEQQQQPRPTGSD